MDNNIISFKNMNFSYANSTKNIFENLNFILKTGDFIAILGENGKGKSTFLKLCAGILIPNSGNVYVGKINTNSENKQKRLKIRKKIGYIFQNPDKQIFGLTVNQDIAFGAKNFGIKKSVYEKKSIEILNLLKISHLANSEIRSLSVGEKQLVALASCLIVDPSVILIDEPSSTLDESNSKNLFELLTKLNKQFQKTIIFSTHNIRDTTFVNQVLTIENMNLKKVFLTKFNDIKIKNFPAKISDEYSETISNNSILRFDDVCFHYKKSKKDIVNNLNFDLKPNSILGIFGYSFCGKSTIAKLISGQISPTSGKITKNDNLKTGLVTQQSEKNFFFENVCQDITFGLSYMNFSENTINKRLEEIFELLKLDKEFLKRNISELSGGEKKLIAISGILINQPEILVLDEPLMSLDVFNKNLIAKTIFELKTKKKTSIILISNREENLLKICDDVIFLKNSQFSDDSRCQSSNSQGITY